MQSRLPRRTWSSTIAGAHSIPTVPNNPPRIANNDPQNLQILGQSDETRKLVIYRFYSKLHHPMELEKNFNMSVSEAMWQHAVLCQSLGFADLIIPCEERGEHEAYSSGLECVA